MTISRRNFLIKSIGSAIVAGMTPPLLAELLPKKTFSGVDFGMGDPWDMTVVSHHTPVEGILMHPRDYQALKNSSLYRSS